MPMTTAAEVIEWLEALRVTEGPLAGEPLKMLPFQRRFVRGLLKKPIETLARLELVRRSSRVEPCGDKVSGRAGVRQVEG